MLHVKQGKTGENGMLEIFLGNYHIYWKLITIKTNISIFPPHLECPLENVGEVDPEGSRVESLTELGGDEAPLHVDIVRGRGDC